MVDADFARMSIHEPKVTDSKYTRGVVGLITGSVQYPGAAVLSTTAAARSNIGMVRYLGPQHAQDLVLQALPEATMGKGRVEAWVVGSGVPGKTRRTFNGRPLNRCWHIMNSPIRHRRNR